jgi:hypothetical protein
MDDSNLIVEWANGNYRLENFHLAPTMNRDEEARVLVSMQHFPSHAYSFSLTCMS